MKTRLLSISFLFTCVFAQAQPVINNLYDYQPGDQYIFRQIVPGTTIDTATIPTYGANLTWDFTNVPFNTDADTNTIIDYASSLFPTSFPGATYVMDEYIGIQQYYRKSNDSIYYMGNNYGGVPLSYTPNPLTIVLPATYGPMPDNNFGPMTTTLPGGSVWTYRGRYNGWGTLILPGGFVKNNIGLYIVTGGTSAQHFSDYIWASENGTDPLLRIQFMHMNGNTTINLAYLTVSALTSVENAATAPLSDVQITPNPARNQLNIQSNEIILEFQIVDIAGRIMTRHACNSKSAGIDISSLPVGTYFARLRGLQGTWITRQVTKL